MLRGHRGHERYAGTGTRGGTRLVAGEARATTAPGARAAQARPNACWRPRARELWTGQDRRSVGAATHRRHAEPCQVPSLPRPDLSGPCSVCARGVGGVSAERTCARQAGGSSQQVPGSLSLEGVLVALLLFACFLAPRPCQVSLLPVPAAPRQPAAHTPPQHPGEGGVGHRTRRADVGERPVGEGRLGDARPDAARAGYPGQARPGAWGRGGLSPPADTQLVAGDGE
jgi:hypothetical protein